MLHLGPTVPKPTLPGSRVTKTSRPSNTDLAWEDLENEDQKPIETYDQWDITIVKMMSHPNIGKNDEISLR